MHKLYPLDLHRSGIVRPFRKAICGLLASYSLIAPLVANGQSANDCVGQSALGTAICINPVVDRTPRSSNSASAYGWIGLDTWPARAEDGWVTEVQSVGGVGAADAFCRAIGGSWTKVGNNFYCDRTNSIPLDDANVIAVMLETFTQSFYGSPAYCDGPRVSFDTGWGWQGTDGGFIYSNSYTNGELTGQYRQLGITATPKDSYGNCLSEQQLFWRLVKGKRYICPAPIETAKDSYVSPNRELICRVPFREMCPAVATDRGNPVDIVSGVKHQTDIQVAASASNPSFSIGLLYRSTGIYGGGMSSALEDRANWTHSFDYRLLFGGGWGFTKAVSLPSGITLFFDSAGKELTLATASRTSLSQAVEGTEMVWKLRMPDSVVVFDAAGRTKRVEFATGQRHSYAYDTLGKLGSITDAFGRQVFFSYQRDKLVGLSIGETSLSFELDSLERITSVNVNGARHRSYAYLTKPTFLLTELRDAFGNLVGKYGYDNQGRGISTEAGGGFGRYTFERLWNYVNWGVRVTDPLLSVSDVWYKTQNGVQVYQQTQPAGAGCAASAKTIDYLDGSGRANVVTDFAGRRRCVANDVGRGLEVARIDGLLAQAQCPADARTYVPPAGSEQRKILTQWHPDWRLETRRSEPKKLTTWVYNGQPDPTAGNAITSCAPTDALVDSKPIAVLCKQVEQATSDETGGTGFGAIAVGTARIQRWTYNRYGQVLTANGPRTDNPGGRDDLTTYEYYADTQTDWTMGDLKQVTNALGHITRYPKYNRNGWVLRSIEPNGTTWDYVYAPRGWLRQVKVTPQGDVIQLTTSYEYDSEGVLLRTTLPDGTSTTYTYDAARRLTDITDSAGNRVSYTLDAMGNRTREEWKDTGGTLRKTITRTIDALNRVQQVVGAAQ